MRGEIDLDARGCLTLGCYRLAPIPSVREVRELARPPIEFDVPLTLSHPFLTPCSVGADTLSPGLALESRPGSSLHLAPISLSSPLSLAADCVARST